MKNPQADPFTGQMRVLSQCCGEPIVQASFMSEHWPICSGCQQPIGNRGPDKRNDFLLPSELGWQCNDEMQDKIDAWMQKVVKDRQQYKVEPGEMYDFMRVSKAELIDDLYAIIKKYQEPKQ